MRLAPASGALLLLICSSPALAQAGGPPVAFSAVTGIPVQSTSGRFSAVNPPEQKSCGNKRVSGRVVSPRLIMVKDISCGRPGHENVLVNVELGNPMDAAQMVTGRQVAIAARFKSAEEDRFSHFVAEFLIAENAKIVGGDPLDRSVPPAPAFTSYMMCQPPELEALAARLGKDLCVQSTLVADLTATGPALEAAARAPANISPTDTVPGDANAISCRLDPARSDTDLSAIACARNSYWAWYSAKWPDPLSPTPAPP